MKKLLPVLTTAVIACMCGCGSKTPAAPVTAPAPSAAPASTPVPVAAVEMNVESTQSVTPTPLYTPTPSPVPAVSMGGKSVLITEKKAVLSSAEDFEALGAFLDLEEADASQVTVTPGEAAYYQKKYPGTAFLFTVELHGRTVTAETETLDLHGEALEQQELADLLDVFPNLKKIDVRDCGLSDEQLGGIAFAHPDTRLVWEVKLANHVLRTDAVGFSTLNPSKYYNEKSSEAYKKKVKETKRLYTEDIEVLKYCPDLVALDLGHNYIDDLSVLKYLKNLQILIVADNKLSDISVLAGLPDLVYVEFFMNEVKDIGPLAGHEKLLDLNFCNNEVEDLSPLETMPQLERVWCAGNKFKRAAGKALQDIMPGCIVDYTARDDTADGWREHERYEWMRAYVKGEHNPA